MDLELDLEGTPYSLSSAAVAAISRDVTALDDRVRLLRAAGTLTDATLLNYYGERRFEQIAESNAIEGSTLSVGETEVAVLKGATLTGHDPGYVRDARALAEALDRLADMARDGQVATIERVKLLHELILGGRPSAGAFRTKPVRIKGLEHRPPKTWDRVMSAMEAWDAWSRANADTPAVIRAAVLHAWLAYIHPFSDGNGRTARAIMTLELVRAGYPPVIIKAKQRTQYLDALQHSDAGGDLGGFIHLIVERAQGAVTGLELSARKHQGYDPLAAKVEARQRQQLQVWNAAVSLIAEMLGQQLSEAFETRGGEASVRIYDDRIDLEDYIELCKGTAASQSWAFEVRVSTPGVVPVVRLAWVGFRSPAMRGSAGLDVHGPALFWSMPNPGGYPRWRRADGTDAPKIVEATLVPGRGDQWWVDDGRVRRVSAGDMVEWVRDGFLELLEGA